MPMSIIAARSVTQEKLRVRLPGAPGADPRIAFFDRQAPDWDRDAAEVEETLARLGQLGGRLELRPGQDLLEIGCGTGRISGWLTEAVAPGRVVCADFSPAMLAQAQARRLPVDYWEMDICDEAVGEALFDVVFCFHAFPHFRDQQGALCNIRRLLKPRGRLLILHLAGSAELNAFHSALSHPVCHDLLPGAGQWPALLAKAGLQLASLTDETGLFLLAAHRV
jgi:ubiquinone/menaquinone biosynthesis C-methylase UbiE